MGCRKCALLGAWISAILLITGELVVAAPLLVHAYEFNESLADIGPGGVTIGSEGGAVVGTVYEFDPIYPGDYNQGLTLSSPALSNMGVYSIEMRLKYDRLRNETPPGSYGPDQSWIKTIDFTNGLHSYGLYVEDVVRWNGPGQQGLIEFIASTDSPPYYNYVGVSPPRIIQADEWFHLVATRDSSGTFACYIDGSKVFEFVDDRNDAVIDAELNTLRFFQPDEQAILEYNVYEVTKGSVDYIRLYDQALTASEVLGLFAPAVLGDLNGDQLVDGDDLAIWTDAFGVNDTGDIDGNGITDGRDFLIWQQAFNGGATALNVVPEPSAAILLAAMFGATALPYGRGVGSRSGTRRAT